MPSRHVLLIIPSSFLAALLSGRFMFSVSQSGPGGILCLHQTQWRDLVRAKGPADVCVSLCGNVIFIFRKDSL